MTFQELFDRLKDGIQKEDVDAVGRQLVRWVADALPGASSSEKYAKAEEALLKLIEEYDHTIPLIGKYMDLPFINFGQSELTKEALKRFLKPFIEWVYYDEIAVPKLQALLK